MEKIIPRSLVLIFLFSSIIFFGRYLFFHPLKLQLLYQSWDGPAYVVVAKSFYNPILIDAANTVRLPTYYFANHFPLYPVFIKLLSFIGYWRSALVISQVFALLFTIAIYNLFKKIYPKEKLNWIAIPLIFFPARWFTITHIGSSEPLFLFLVTLFLFQLTKNKHLSAAIFLALAQFTRHGAIWFFIGLAAYALYLILTKKITITKAIKTYYPYLLVPLALIAVNVIFYLRYGDFSFWVANAQKASYFQLIPFKILLPFASDTWKESLIFNYLMYLGAVLLFFREKKYQFGFLMLFNFIPLVFLVQEDLSRIALSSLPLLYLAYHKLITNKLFQIAIIILIPAIYLFSFGFIEYNISP